MAFFRQNALPQDTICTRENPAKRGNFEIVEGGLPVLTGIRRFSTILVHPPEKKEYNFFNFFR